MTDNTSTQTEPGTLRRLVACCNDLTERDRSNVRRYGRWMMVWLLGFAAVIFGLKYEVLPTGLPAWLAIVASTALGVVAVLAFVRFVREADELVRKIQLEALALGFGAGYVANFTLALVEKAGSYTVDGGDVFMLMIAAYIVGVVLGTRRYA